MLPSIDEHATEIRAGVEAVWPALLATFSGAGGARYARLVGCDDVTASGPRPLAVGSTIPGFHVTEALPGERLVLEGRHRFSTYALIFRLEPLDVDRSRLVAESRGEFPGWLGRAYRLAVIGSRGHAVGVRRLLAGVRRRAEG